MAIEKFYFVPRKAGRLPEWEYKDYLYEAEKALSENIESFSLMKASSIYQMRHPESVLLHIIGEDKTPDIIIIDDDHETIAYIFNQCEENGTLNRILAIDHPDSIYWLLEQNVQSPKIITLDFILLQNDLEQSFKITESLYRSIKEKWPTTCVIGLTNIENHPPARQLENLIRGQGESVLNKLKFMEILSHFFRDRLVMHELKMQNLALQTEIQLQQTKLQEKEEEIQRLKEPLPQKSGKEYLVGESEAMQYVWRDLNRIKNSRSAKVILIEGQTGTGKKTVARAIVENWGIKKYDRVRCGTLKLDKLHNILTENQNEAIILDGLENLSSDLQEFLIDIIDAGQLRQGEASESSKVKLILLCTGDLNGLSQLGKISETFFSRISSFRISIPPLKLRKDDISRLVSYMTDLWVEEYPPAKAFLVHTDAVRYLGYYDFPSNVRELEGVVKRAMDDSFADTPIDRRDHIHIEKKYFERQITGPNEEELISVEQFLNEVENDAQLVLEKLNIPADLLKQRHLEEVTKKKNYRQKIDNFFKIGKREDVARILFAREIEKWPAIRHIRPFKSYN